MPDSASISQLWKGIRITQPIVEKAIRFHSLRVFYLSSKLARILNCHDRDLQLAALLHDIGKMGIAPSILFKPGKLSELEYIIIQSHCHIGNRLIREKLGLKRTAVFVRDHHERWDGKGYPRGLMGEQIPIQARIINICDAFDTMTVEQRSYKREALPVQKALQEIRRCRGTQFCPYTAVAFNDMIRNHLTNHQWTTRVLPYDEIEQLVNIG